MNVDEYVKKYTPNAFFGVAANKSPTYWCKIYRRHVVETTIHCSLDKIESYEIVQCGDVWVLLGKLYDMYCVPLGGKWSEIAVAIDKNELEIWKDLNNLS